MDHYQTKIIPLRNQILQLLIMDNKLCPERKHRLIKSRPDYSAKQMEMSAMPYKCASKFKGIVLRSKGGIC